MVWLLRLMNTWSVWLVLIGVLLTLPLLCNPTPTGHDFLHHLLFSHHFSQQFWQGELYPRWMQAMNAGFGSPTFFFYPPLPYWVTALCQAVLPTQGAGDGHPLALAALLALIASGVTARAWLLGYGIGQRAALLGALLYMAQPYHLLIDLYQRYAFAEFWAFVWLPMILHGSVRLAQGGRLALAQLAGGVAALTLSHLPVLLLASPLIALHTLWLWRRQPTLGQLARQVAGLSLGLGLAAIYWLPAMTTQQYVSIPAMLEGILDYRRHFLDIWPDAQHGFTFRRNLSFVAAANGLLALAGWWQARRHSDREARHTALLWLLLSAALLLWMAPLARPLWDALPILQQVQFPWRIQTLLCVSVLPILGLALQVGAQHRQGVALWHVLWLLLMLIEVSVMADRLFRQHPQTRLDTLFVNRRSPLEYRPSWVPSDRFSVPGLLELARTTPTLSSEPPTTRWQILDWQPRRLKLQLAVPTASQLTLHQFFYPGWQARRDTDATPLTLGPDANGLLRLALPAGHYRVQLTLKALPQELAGRGISLLALLLLLWASRPRPKATPAPGLRGSPG
ncbi:hypothetical protein [Pseudaeromonas paramecii]|uniref:Membrane protein 6-pyruvoyl-tetrahydropterin synthase-related domain-containing protein n=1 Tax=Pseudaeromonas paramecii TaxID=2138166 RepID=A0ABP8Q925_9GAMM